MNLAATGFVLALGLSLLAALAAMLAAARLRRAIAGALTAAGGAAAAISGSAALLQPDGASFSADLPELLPLFGVHLYLDALGGVFVAVTGAVAMVSAIYAVGYTRPANGAAGMLDNQVVQGVFPLFVAAMLLVPAASSVGTLLVAWELMALSSLVLVVAEHRARAEVAAAGLWYGVMTHLGLVAIMLGLMVFTSNAPDDTFASLRTAAAELGSGASALVFLATFAGFASKAGAVPLHAWLPRAHPEAPSHVSALMSAAMVNLGIYGIVRVGFDLLGVGARWWWFTVLAVGAVSAVYGILQAAMSTDLKRLLAYSTTENMGLILVGVGAAGIFEASGNHGLAGLAMAAALLHLVNHAAFKSLLFMAAGSVLHATHTRDLDDLGGLRTRMPGTTAMFAIGALAASALPLGSAFVSEWLLLQSLIHGVAAAGLATAVAMPIAVAAVALTAGVAVATFVKAFGVGFLAKPRTAAAECATESSPVMIAAMTVAAATCVVLAMAPTVVVPALAPAVGATRSLLSDPATEGALTLDLVDVAGSLSPLLLAAALAGAAIGVLMLLRLASMWITSRAGARHREVRLWDCGAGPLSARMEYTATSFAEPLQRVFDNVLEPELDVNVTHVQESRYLVDRVDFQRRVPDRIERRLYQPVLKLVAAWGKAGRQLATGSVHRYLGYGFVTLIGVLVALAVTR